MNNNPGRNSSYGAYHGNNTASSSKDVHSNVMATNYFHPIWKKSSIGSNIPRNWANDKRDLPLPFGHIDRASRLEFQRR